MFAGLSELFSRFFHWGPLTALTIIKCVTLTCLYITSMWFPPSQGLIATINHVIYLILIAVVLYNFFCAMFIGPGYVSRQWRPANTEHCRFLQWCAFCDGFKPPRAHHCRKCQNCVLKMDHHCPWINNCCGHRNHAYFTYFLLSAVVGSIHSTTLLIIALYRAYYLNWYFYNDDPNRLVVLSITTLFLTIFSIGLSIGVVIAVGGLLIIQLKSIVKNCTGIEEWIVIKAKSRDRAEDDPFIYPYDLGWTDNLKQVFCWPTDDGITWPVLPGCDQYTLTIEQLIQKEEKRLRSRQYKIIDNYNGSWFPLFSQGPRICLSYPLTDEPRIPVNVNDIILVTRWKNRWMYGEKTQAGNNHLEKLERQRGWFPSRCAVEVIVANDFSKSSQKHSNASSKKLN